MAIISRSGAVVRHSYFQIVIGTLNRGSIPKKQHFILIIFFYFKNYSGYNQLFRRVVRHRYFQSVIGPLNRGSIP